MPKARTTCTACSMRRQKCDRNLPCGRCVKRGEADICTREWPEEGYDPKIHRTYPKPGKSVGSGSPQAETPEDSDLGDGHTVPESSVHQLMQTPPSVTSGTSIQRSRLPNSTFNHNPIDGLTSPAQVTDVGNTPALPDYENWARTKLADVEGTGDLLREPVGTYKEPAPDWDFSNGFGGTGLAQVSFLQLLLPSRAQLFQIVDYHINSVLWYHCIFHGPTLMEELRHACRGPAGLQIKDTDLRWSALLFATMAGSMACATEKVAASWGFQKNERLTLTRQWFKATLCCLNVSDYMWRHHIYSVQAIATLSMSAHILGFSNTQSTLLGAALKIGQGLALHRIPEEDDDHPLPGSNGQLSLAQRDRVIRRESGRRFWSQLCIQDWFSIPFADMYSIQPRHFVTVKPGNRDEETMELLPPEVATMSSYGCMMQGFAALVRQSHDAYCDANTLFTKYDSVLLWDGKLREKMKNDIHPALDDSKPFDPSYPKFCVWARRSNKIVLLHKLLMLHRNFLGRSFTEKTFEFTRQTCIKAAKDILDAALQPADSDAPLLWIEMAFTVAAAITLTLDLFHRRPHEPEYKEHRRLAQLTINHLDKFDNNMVALRGVRLLSSLLAEQARLTAHQSLEDYRKRSLTDMNNNNHNTGLSTTQSVSSSTSTTPHPTNHKTSPYPQPKRQKFDVPKFVETFVGNTNNNVPNFLRTPQAISEKDLGAIGFFEQANLAPSGNQPVPPNQPQTNPSLEAGMDDPSMTGVQQNDNATITDNFLSDPNASMPFDLGYETFDQLFPPQAGLSNTYLFEDLLNFDF